jgi:hypothetical protein
MSGYLQRLARTNLERGESIQPVLGSLFSAGKSANKSESLPEPDLGDKESPQAILTPIAISNQVSLVPGAQTESDIVHDLRANSNAREALEALRNEASADTAETKTAQRQISKTAHSASTELVSTSPLISTWAPLVKVSVPIRTTETPVFPSLVQRNDQYQPEGRNRSAASSTGLAKPEAEPVREQAPVRTTNPEQDKVSSGGQGHSAGSKQTFWQVEARLGKLRFGPDGKERVGLRASGTTQREPDEIEIHIGRIEVIAVPPAPPIVTSPKRKHGAPSLNEYLQRRNGRSV